jgi:hypothetical protein
MNRDAMERHPLDLVSLLGGLLFMGLGTAFLFDALNVWSADVTWVPPIVLIVLGLAGVLSTVGRQRPLEPAAEIATDLADPVVDDVPVGASATDDEGSSIAP